MDTKSLRRSSSSSGATSTPSSLTPGNAERDEASTRMPSACAIAATRVPIVPSPPTSPIVFPVSSKCGQLPRWQRSMWARSPVAIALACGTSEHESDITKVIAICAIASVEYVGMLQTVMPLARAAAVSMLLKPVPASQISLTDGGKASMSDAGSGISLLMTTSLSATRATTSEGSLAPCLLTSATAERRDQSRRWSKSMRSALSRTARSFAELTVDMARLSSSQRLSMR